MKCGSVLAASCLWFLHVCHHRLPRCPADYELPIKVVTAGCVSIFNAQNGKMVELRETTKILVVQAAGKENAWEELAFGDSVFCAAIGRSVENVAPGAFVCYTALQASPNFPADELRCTPTRGSRLLCADTMPRTRWPRQQTHPTTLLIRGSLGPEFKVLCRGQYASASTASKD